VILEYSQERLRSRPVEKKLNTDSLTRGNIMKTRKVSFKIAPAIVVLGILSLVITGCPTQDKEPPADEHPTGEHVTGEHPAGEHPKAKDPEAKHQGSEHPSSEHPSSEHPK
jgi:hypothetical protein